MNIKYIHASIYLFLALRLPSHRSITYFVLKKRRMEMTCISRYRWKMYSSIVIFIKHDHSFLVRNTKLSRKLHYYNLISTWSSNCARYYVKQYLSLKSKIFGSKEMWENESSILSSSDAASLKNMTIPFDN